MVAVTMVTVMVAVTARAAVRVLVVWRICRVIGLDLRVKVTAPVDLECSL